MASFGDGCFVSFFLFCYVNEAVAGYVRRILRFVKQQLRVFDVRRITTSKSQLTLVNSTTAVGLVEGSEARGLSGREIGLVSWPLFRKANRMFRCSGKSWTNHDIQGRTTWNDAEGAVEKATQAAWPGASNTGFYS